MKKAFWLSLSLVASTLYAAGNAAAGDAITVLLRGDLKANGGLPPDTPGWR